MKKERIYLTFAISVFSVQQKTDTHSIKEQIK
jgi:hypothetical protein